MFFVLIFILCEEKKVKFFLLYVNMSECADSTYYQRNRYVILNRAKNYYKNDKERLRDRQEVNTETYLKRKKIKKENMEGINTTICLKKKNKI